MFVAIKKLAMAIRIAITIYGALLLYPLRYGYDARARSKLHGVFGCSFLRPPKKTENTRNITAALSLASTCSNDFRKHLLAVTEPPPNGNLQIVRALKPRTEVHLQRSCLRKTPCFQTVNRAFGISFRAAKIFYATEKSLERKDRGI